MNFWDSETLTRSQRQSETHLTYVAKHSRLIVILLVTVLCSLNCAAKISGLCCIASLFYSLWLSIRLPLGFMVGMVF